MKSTRIHAADPERLAELRLWEEAISHHPSAEAYLELADQYREMGLNKDSDRLVQLAESAESNGHIRQNTTASDGLMSGTANPLMLTEVVQILSRTKHSGDLTINASSETFHIYFDQGRIIYASSQSFPAGEKSFRMALRVTNGSYRFLERGVTEVPRLVDAGTDILLLDAMNAEDTEAAEKQNA